MTKAPFTQLQVIVNRAGGAAAAAGEALPTSLAEAFAAAGVSVEIRLVGGREIGDAVREAAGDGRVVIAGGDGSVAAAAQALKGSDTELAIIPLGTLNHLAQDLGLPMDMAEAAALAAHGRAEPIDVGEVNGHRFVNNVSIGLYPFMVQRREAVRRLRGWAKWLATGPAAWAALERLPHHRLRLDIGADERRLVTPLLFVGNNRYALEAGAVGRRASLQDGVLSLYAIPHRSRASLIWFALRTLVGRADPAADFLVLDECRAFTVRSSGDSIEIALDGEVRRLPSPLEFRIDPGALSVVVPDRSAEQAGEGGNVR